MDTLVLLNRAYKMLQMCPVPREGQDFGPSYEFAVAEREQLLKDMKKHGDVIRMARKLVIK
jgi:hypothetical protein